MRKRIVVLTLALLSTFSVAGATVPNNPVSRYEGVTQKQRKGKEIKLFVKNGKLGDVLQMFSRLTGISYVLENDVGVEEKNIAGGEMTINPEGENQKQVKSDLYNVAVTVAYKGRNPDELMKLICKAADVYCEKDFNGVWRVKRYEEYITNLPISFDYSIAGGGTLTTAGNTAQTEGGGQETSGGGASSVSYNYSDKDLVNQIKDMLSAEGKLVRSPSGFLAVVDRPSRIEKIKRVLSRQQLMSEPFRLNIKVVRIDNNEGFESGIDWNYVLGGSGAVKITSNLAAAVDNAFSFAVDTSRIQNILKLLSKYGKVKIVKEWTVTARGGHPLFFDDVEEIPWVTSSAVTTDTSTEVADQVNFADVGLKLRLIANAFDENITGDIYAEISDLISIDQLTNSTRAPHSAASRVALSYSVPFNKSVIVSGLTARRKETATEGLPLLSKIPILGYLFKHKAKKDKKQEFIVILTPTPLQ